MIRPRLIHLVNQLGFSVRFERICKTSNSETRVQLAMLAVHAVQSSFVVLCKIIADKMKAYSRYRINTSNGQIVGLALHALR